MSQTSTWPTLVDYQEAVQSPSNAFSDPELRGCAPVTNALGLPRPICGTFASVYELSRGDRRWAIKCFLRNIPDLHERYAKISDHLARVRLPYFVTFEYRGTGIRVRGREFPLVQMVWEEGCPLDEFVARNLEHPRVLKKLKKRWARLLVDLRAARIAHGDLQHGNVLVRSNGQLRLIDYDGMWVPALEGEKSHETGHPNYQSPTRNGHDFDAEIDSFAGSVIELTLAALARDPDLWRRHNNGDNLLLRRADFVDPERSSAIAELRALADPEIEEKLDTISKTCRASAFPQPKRNVSRMRERVRTSPAVAGSWLEDHVPEFRGAVEPEPRIERTARAMARPLRSSVEGPNAATFLRSLMRLLFRP